MLRAERHIWLKAIALSLLVLCLDLGTKALVTANYPLNQQHALLPLVSVFPVHNPGISMSLVGGGVHLPTYLLFALTMLACANVVVQPRRRGQWAMAGLALGGSLGNVLELAYHGYATDFIYVNGSGLSFNFADLAITSALLFSVGLMFRLRRRRPADRPAPAPVSS